MDIDGDELSKACKSDTLCKVGNNLCGSEIDFVIKELKEGQNQIITKKNLNSIENGLTKSENTPINSQK